jgi:AraC family transcriptional regulator of adaptative response / DNA-3-methyladenine glycosylase II
MRDSALYAAFKAKDARFDGRFFVAVSSTGIYCRPVCRAKMPKESNCTFYKTAAEAERAGYRPCLICKPELAPGKSITDAAFDLAYRAAGALEENCGNGMSLTEFAGLLGCTDRHLRRVFTAEYNVSPVQYLQTCRLLLAKSLLTDTALSVLDVAMTAGFGSLRRFNDLFKQRYRLSPTALRKQIPKENRSTALSLALGYRPPYLWDEMLRFLAARTIAGVELVAEDEYIRTARFVTTDGKDASGWVRVGHKPQKNVLTVSISKSLIPALPQVLARVRHLFDLCCSPAAVYEKLCVMNKICPGLSVLGTRIPGSFNAFETAVRAVLGQQITVKAAGTLASRFAKEFGKPLQTEIEGLTYLFPEPEELLALGDSIENRLGALGIISTRSGTIRELARSLVHGEIDFRRTAKPEEEIKKLMAIRGIGKWTAHYIAMRVMESPDVFLETDAGIKKALVPLTEKELVKIAEDWSPWRSYATVNLWNALNRGKENVL